MRRLLEHPFRAALIAFFATLAGIAFSQIIDDRARPDFWPDFLFDVAVLIVSAGIAIGGILRLLAGDPADPPGSSLDG